MDISGQIRVALLMVSLCLISCQKEGRRTGRYLQFFHDEDNGLVQEVEAGGFLYRLLYTTPEYQALIAAKQDKAAPGSLRAVLPQYEGHHYFLLAVRPSVPGKMSAINEPQPGSGNREKFALEAGKAFKLFVSGDTIPCALFHVEPRFGDTYRAAVVFPAREHEEKGGLAFLFEDAFFSNRTLKFQFSKEALNNIPAINL